MDEPYVSQCIMLLIKIRLGISLSSIANSIDIKSITLTQDHSLSFAMVKILKQTPKGLV